MADLNINVSANTRDAERNLRNVSEDLNDVQSSANSASTSTNRLANSVDNASSTARSASSVFSTLFNEISNNAENTTRTVRSSFNSIRDIAGGILVSLGIDNILDSIDNITTSALENASNLADAGDALNHYYHNSLDDLTTWATESAKLYGMSASEALNYLGEFTNTLRNFNFESEEQISKMAINLTKLSGDMAAQFGDDTAKVQKSLYNAVTGPASGVTAALREYGIILKDVNLDNYLLSQGINASYKSLSLQEQGLVRYAYIMKEAQFVQGEFNADIVSWGSSIATLQREIQSLLTIIGQYAIPILQPFINLIAMGAAYAKAFVIELGNVFGWERYLAEASEDTLAPMKSLTDLADDTANSSASTVKNVKKLNTELKKGTKLLDLYYVDLGGSSDVSQDTTIPDAQGTIADLQSLLDGIDYADIASNWLPNFEVDTSKVKDAVKWVKDLWDWATKTFDTIWNFKLGDLPSLSELWDDVLDKLANDPGDLALDIIELIFAASTIRRAAGTVSSYLGEVFSDKSLLTNPNLKTKLAGIGVGIAGLIMSGMGGFNLGQAIYNDNAEDEVTGLIESIGGVVTAAFGGLMVGGPAGAALGAGLGLAGVFVGAIIGEISERRKDILDSSQSLLEGEISVTEMYKSQLDSLFGSTDVTTAAFDTYNSAVDKLNGGLNTLTTEEIPLALSELQADQWNPDKITKVRDAFKEAADKVVALATEESKFSTQIFQQQFQDANGKIEPFKQNILDTLDAISQLNAERKAQEIARMGELEIKSTQGIATSDELQELELLRDKYNVTKDIVSDLPNMNKDFDATAQSLEEYSTQLNKSLEITQTAYDISAKDLKEALENGFISTDEYTVAMETLNTQLADIRKQAAALYKDAEANVAMKVKFYVTSVAVTGGDSEKNLMTAREALKRVYDTDSPVEISQKILVDPVFEPYGTHFEDIPKFILEQLGRLYGINPSDINYREEAIALYEASVAMFSAKVNLDLAAGTISIDRLKDAWGADSTTNGLVIDAMKQAGYQVVEQNGQITAIMPTRPTFELKEAEMVVKTAAVNLPEDAKKSIASQMAAKVRAATADSTVSTEMSNGLNDAATGVNPSAAANTTADAFAGATKTALEDDKNIQTVAAGINANLAGAETKTDAQTKGTELGEAYISGLTTAISNAHQQGSSYRSALDLLVSDFKSALNNISSLITQWSGNLSTGINGLNIPNDVTFTGLLSLLKTNKINIPMLANGAVIPPNNPFLAVLGDQRSGTNIEAPVGVIREAVEDAAQPNVTVENRVYIGNREIQDFIVDTVIDSNLVTG